jgi:hypothetical protein
MKTKGGLGEGSASVQPYETGFATSRDGYREELQGPPVITVSLFGPAIRL